MIRNHLALSARRLRRRPGTTFIHVTGLALGLACSLLIALFVRDELSYDRAWPDARYIYRVTTELESEEEGGTEQLASTFAAVAPAARASIPAVLAVARLNGNALNKTLVTAGDVQYYEDGLFSADAAIFDVFGIRLVRGDAQTALARPNTVVLTESQARRYFADLDPLGGTLTIRSEDFVVTGVMEDLPTETHLTFSLLTSLATQEAKGWMSGHEWRLFGFYTYLRLGAAADPDAVAKRIAELSIPIENQERSVFRLQPLTDIHLRSHLSSEMGSNGDIRYVWLFGSVALLVLLIACVNYMNLASAVASRRAWEVGVRKVVGAERRQIVAQFLIESMLVAGMALLVAIVVIELALPWFNGLTGKSLSLDYAREGGVLALVAIAAGLVAGSYPAAILSSFRPIRAISSFGTMAGRGVLRRALVVFQFTVSIALITATVVVQRQLNYVQEEHLGFDKERLVTLHTADRLADGYEAFKRELLADARIVSVTTSTNVPGNLVYNEYGMKPDSGDARFYLTYTNVDFDFARTMGVELVSGRDLSREHGTDMEKAILLNETAVRKMGWPDAVGRTLFGRDVVGVVKDYMTTSSKDEVKAGGFIPHTDVQRFVVVRLAPGSTAGAVDLIRDTWETFVPEAPLDFSFVDADIDLLYRSEQRLGRVFVAFSLLAIFIACLGLFGLAAFAAEQRTKEIGIRKVLGASLAGIVGLLSREFVALVAISLCVGGPLAWFLMNRWLEDYVYRVGLDVRIPLAAGALTLAIALVTVGWHAVRAATADPVQSLRRE